MTELSKTTTGRVHTGIIGKIARFWRKSDGVVSIEAAIIFPTMIILSLGMIDGVAAISMKRKITVAASAVVDLTTQESTSVSTASLNEFILAADAILKPLPSSGINVELINFKRDGSDVSERWSFSRGGCGATPSSLSGANLDKLTAEGNDIVAARVCTSFQPLIGYVIGTGAISLEETVSQRPREGKTLLCNNKEDNC
jgi:Flp pilus assembly protein TadG